MILVYASKTHNVERFCEKITKYESVRVQDYEPSMGKYVLVTYTDGFGEAPKEVEQFLEKYHSNMVGVCASGRQIWKLHGTYCKSADVIHNQYGVPILLKFEMAGTDKDRAELVERIENIEQQKLY
jgi:protein involved in ribonucleotide reduction